MEKVIELTDAVKNSWSGYVRTMQDLGKLGIMAFLFWCGYHAYLFGSNWVQEQKDRFFLERLSEAISTDIDIDLNPRTETIEVKNWKEMSDKEKNYTLAFLINKERLTKESLRNAAETIFEVVKD